MAGHSHGRCGERLRRGGREQRGLDDLRRLVQRRRRDLLRPGTRLDGTLEEVRELLDRAVLAERKQLARDLDDDARFAEMRIENLPASTASAVTELSNFRWRPAEAKEAYERIKDLLGRELLDQRFAGMKQALEGATDEDRQRVNAMLEDLNDLLEAHARGDTPEQFAEFMDKHGDLFPENPRNVDASIDALAKRAAAAQRMLNSMTQEQRDELMAMAQQAFGSPSLQQSMARLDATLRALRPDQDWDGGQSFRGDQGLGLGDGTGVLQDLAELDALGEQLSQQYAGARMDDIDLDALSRQLGDEAAVEARTLQELARELAERGYLRRTSDGSQRLSPKAMRELGRALLRDVATRLGARPGQRDVRQAGAAGERSGATREWAFGDVEPWDVTRTLTRAIQRTASEGEDPRQGMQDAAWATSRSFRPRHALAPWSRCSSTPHSRWPWTGDGCR